MDNDFHSLDPDHRLDIPPSAPIILEENVWIGVRATVLRGVTIGAGSDTSLATQLHEEAHRFCFIANSVKTKVTVEK